MLQNYSIISGIKVFILTRLNLLHAQYQKMWKYVAQCYEPIKENWNVLKRQYVCKEMCGQLFVCFLFVRLFVSLWKVISNFLLFGT